MLKIVDHRDKDTLQDLIVKHVKPLSCIYSDMWRAYNGIENLDQGFVHKMVNHSITFVNEENRDVHTNSVESLWRNAKQKFKQMHGAPHNYIQEYLTEFVSRESCTMNRLNAFEKLLEIIPYHWRGIELDDKPGEKIEYIDEIEGKRLQGENEKKKESKIVKRKMVNFTNEVREIISCMSHEHIFPATLTAAERRVIHIIAEDYHLYH